MGSMDASGSHISTSSRELCAGDGKVVSEGINRLVLVLDDLCLIFKHAPLNHRDPEICRRRRQKRRRQPDAHGLPPILSALELGSSMFKANAATNTEATVPIATRSLKVANVSTHKSGRTQAKLSAMRHACCRPSLQAKAPVGANATGSIERRVYQGCACAPQPYPGSRRVRNLQQDTAQWRLADHVMLEGRRPLTGLRHERAP